MKGGGVEGEGARQMRGGRGGGESGRAGSMLMLRGSMRQCCRPMKEERRAVYEGHRGLIMSTLEAFICLAHLVPRVNRRVGEVQ